jgi:flagellar L-ring protein FlgH
MTTFRNALALTLTATLLGACGAADRLARIGQAPALSNIEDPTAQPGYKPVRLPMPAPQFAAHSSNSLWRQGSRAFFKDQRARQVGDLVNQTQRSRSGRDSMGVPNFFGAESNLPQILPNAVDPGALVGTNSNTQTQGSGSVRRSEQLSTSVATIVTQVLPNGNLVIEGKQEMRINFEVRELIVAGVVRPEDIESDNTIDSTKIAQARIAYGGRGQITDVQQPRYGQQALDVLLPF